jgi:hypothetical protein
VTGLNGELALLNNGVDELGVKADGTSAFTKKLTSNSQYEVTIKTLPADQRCDLGPNAKGMIGTDNVTVKITCTTNPPHTHTLSVSVTGLSGTLKLHEQNGTDPTVTTNGITPLATLTAPFDYAITITTQPDGQHCDLGANAAGTVGDSDTIDAVIVGITCSDIVVTSHVVSVNVTGLTGRVVLQNNGGDDLTVPTDGVAFRQRVAVGGSYNVTVRTQPAGQTCLIPAGSGAIADSDVAVDVSCQPNDPGTHTLSVSVSGLDSSGSNSVVLSNDGGPAVTLTASNPNFTFGAFAKGVAYAVAIFVQPSYPAAECAFVGSGAGVMGDSDVALQINCTAFPVISTFKADVTPFFARTVPVTWPQPAAATDFNLYISTTADCDFRTCGEKQVSVRSGGVINRFGNQPLENGQLYFFQLETEFRTSDGMTVRGLSNKAAARPNSLSFSEKVNAMTAAPNGTVYVGGDFQRVGVSSGSFVALDRKTGGLAGVQVPAVAGAVSALVADGAGGWYLGGEFTHVGNVVRHNLAHVMADGSVDAAFDHGTDGRVRALAVVDSTLYVGGEFNVIAPATGTSPSNVAAIDLRDGSLVSWSPNPDSAVRAIAHLGGAVYIGGDFTNLQPRFAGFAIDGAGLPATATPSALNLDVSGRVEVLTARDDSLYIGGRFTSIGGRPQSGIARLDLVGGQPTLSDAFRPDPTVPGIAPVVKAIVVSDDASLVWIGGSFSEVLGAAGREPRNNLAAVRASNGTATQWAPNPNDVVTALAVQGNTIYIGGYFNGVGPGALRAARAGLAALNLSSGNALELNPDVRSADTTIDAVQSLVVTGDTLYMGGSFTHLGGVDRGHLAAVDPQGGLTGWTPTADDRVQALRFHNNSTFGPVVYAGGFFNFVNNRPHLKLAALNANTGDDTVAFDARVNGTVVNAIAVLDSAGLYIGGDFFSIGSNPSTTSPNVARLLLSNGKIDTVNGGFLQADPNGPVNALVAARDASLGADVVYIGGAFANLGGASNLAKVRADSGGAVRDSLGRLVFQGADAAVNTLALDSTGSALYVGGAFNNIFDVNGAQPTPGGLAQVGTAGGFVHTGCPGFGCFNPQPDPGPGNGRPLALALINDSTVLAAGAFIGIGRAPIPNFAALDVSFLTHGDALRRFVFPNGPVSALTVSGNKIYIGGKFSGFNGSIDGASGAGLAGNFGIVDVPSGGLVP